MATQTLVLNPKQLQTAYTGIKSVAGNLGVNGAYEGPVDRMVEGFDVNDSDFTVTRQLGAQNLTIRNIVSMGLTQPDQRIVDNNLETFLDIDKKPEPRALLDKPIFLLTKADAKQLAAFPGGNALLLSVAATEAILTAKGLLPVRNDASLRSRRQIQSRTEAELT